MSKRAVILNTSRDGYSIGQIRKTMTVGELIEMLECSFDDDEKIYLSFDNGYTYGGISETDFLEHEEDLDNE